MIDPRRLASFTRRQEENSDPESAVRRAGPDEAMRLSCAGYMELTDDAGAFSCGNCKYASTSGAEPPAPEEVDDADDGEGGDILDAPNGAPPEVASFDEDTPDGGPFCTLAEIRAPISTTKGCCSRFFPAEGWPVFGADGDSVNPMTVAVASIGIPSRPY